MNSNVCVIELLKFHWTAGPAFCSAYLPAPLSIYPSCATRFLRGVRAWISLLGIATFLHFCIYFNLWPSAVQFISDARAASANGVKTKAARECWLCRPRRLYRHYPDSTQTPLSVLSNRTAMQSGLELEITKWNNLLKNFEFSLRLPSAQRNIFNIWYWSGWGNLFKFKLHFGRTTTKSVQLFLQFL